MSATAEEKLRALAELPPKEMYARLCEVKQQAAEEDLDYLGEKIEKLLKAEKTAKIMPVLHSAVEVLRISAPYNPFSEETVQGLFKHLAIRGPKQAEDKKALEIIACYKMVALLENVKTVNSLAELALLNLSQKWSLEMLQSIVEEKEEDLGKEVKAKIVKKIADGSSVLGGFIEKHPLLFMPAVCELITTASRSKMGLVAKFNALSKEIVSREAIEACLDEKTNKKDFLNFVGESTVRREMLGIVESLAEDRSMWVRCKVPEILYAKSKSTFYTSATAASIRESAVEIWGRRMHDSSAQVRLEMLKKTTPAQIAEVPEMRAAVLERLRDTNRDVRREALKIAAQECMETLQKDAGSAHAGACFVCRKRGIKTFAVVDVLMSMFIDDHAAQVGLVKAFFASLMAGKASCTLAQQHILAEIFYMVDAAPEDIEKLTGCAAALSVLDINAFDVPDVCSAHQNTVKLLEKVLGPESAPTHAVPSVDSPISIVVMLCEGYPKGHIPGELMEILRKLAKKASEDIFYRVARLISVAEYNTGSGWGAPLEYDSGLPREYLEIKQACTSEGYDFSMDMSRIEDNSLLGSVSMSTDMVEQEKKLEGFSRKMLLMVQMDLLECCIRSAILERTVFKHLLSRPYEEHAYFEGSLFFKQRLVIGIRSHPDTEIRLIFSVVSVLVCRQTSLALNGKSVISVLGLLCWVCIEYTRERAVEAVMSLFRSNAQIAQEFFSFFANLKRFSVEDQHKKTELYVLSEEVHAMLVKEASKLGINPAQYSNDMPAGLVEELKVRGGWAATLSVLDDDHFSANLLTVFKPKPSKQT
ncbi:uncharacterized protein NEMAJ01_1357 [Nematocida major]|uniref:uncharacterized protein n=1 Tax=Nematocida major TaxID=1912982 RepID=UPI00200839CD|nr:uncharacterized protein NEMAJ01_1357 [Nematocida major]KAH9386461.1 hypothetical protein NEMAJ01_1357 [Nematocida major]